MFFSHADLVSHPTIEVTSSPNICLDFRIQEFGIKTNRVHMVLKVIKSDMES